MIMKRSSLRPLFLAAVFVVFTTAVSAPAADRARVESVLAETDARRDAGLLGLLEKPYPPTGAWRHENSAIAAYYRPGKVYDCPYIQSEFGTGVVVLQKGQEKLVLDFNEPQ